MSTKIRTREADMRSIVGFVSKHEGHYSANNLKYMLRYLYLNDGKESPSFDYIGDVVQQVIDEKKIKLSRIEYGDETIERCYTQQFIL